MSMGECGDPSTLPRTAAELFQLAALLMGNGGAAVQLVEETLHTVEMDPCLDPEPARMLAQKALLRQAVVRLRTLDPAGLRAPEAAAGAGAGCVQDDDLGGAGISHAQLSEWLAGDGREDLRQWLAALPTAQRVIFVERAVLGENSAATAELLATGQADGEGWTAPAVGEVYRQALCSLANSLAHAPAHAAHGVGAATAAGAEALSA